jgi:hypothetical protein
MASAQNLQPVPADFQYLKYVELKAKGSHRREDL